jgi:hypothetical protein
MCFIRRNVVSCVKAGQPVFIPDNPFIFSQPLRLNIVVRKDEAVYGVGPHVILVTLRINFQSLTKEKYFPTANTETAAFCIPPSVTWIRHDM